MPNRKTTWGLIAVATVLLFTGPAAATAGQTSPLSNPNCQSSDTTCRLEGIERRLDYLIELTERQRPERFGGGRAGRSVDIPVNQTCGYGVDGCSVLAARLCTQGGFARGVPAETSASVFDGTILVRATCMD